MVAQGASKNQDSVADIVLAGHDDIAEFAVGLSSAAPLVASGGRDMNVSTPLSGMVCWCSLHGADHWRAFEESGVVNSVS